MKTFDQFHDGFLDGLRIHGDIVHFFLRTYDDRQFFPKVPGVLTLKVDGFRQGNIILNVLVREGDELTVEDMVDFYGFKDSAAAFKKLEESQQKNLVVLEINPSYGTACVVLANSVELLPGH